MREENLINFFKSHSQQHIVEHYKQLSRQKQEDFLKAVEKIDLELVFRLYKDFSSQQHAVTHSYDIYPAPIFTIPKDPKELKKHQKARYLGESLICDNKIAVLVMAGGQGSRLGYNAPKGTLPITPIKKKSLFQLFAESVRALSIRYKAVIPLLIMTNPETHQAIDSFFKDHRYFGLKNKTVHLFQQEMLPSITPEGKLILKDETHLFVSPDGHGGSLKALCHSGLLEELIKKGYTDIFYCQIDNPLVRISDPIFIGYHKMEKAEVSTKVVRRRRCEEKVGIFLSEHGKAEVIEYSNIEPENRCVLDEKGNIRDWAGNTGIHVISLSFIRRLNQSGFSLPHHRAIKTVQGLGFEGGKVELTAWKFETFSFDALPLAQKTCCMEIIREEEFSPIKNKDGEDSPWTAQQALITLYKDWLRYAGVEAINDARIEISPFFALDKEELSEKLKGQHLLIDRDTYFE